MTETENETNTEHGMICSKRNSHDTGVSDSRPSDANGGSVRRRRYCKVCGHRFTTYEIRDDYVAYIEKTVAVQMVSGLLNKIVPGWKSFI